jgi:hypothetical protein
MTRAEMMKIVLEARFDGEEDTIGDPKNCFTDVTDQRYALYVCYAADNNMIKGIGNGLF